MKRLLGTASLWATLTISAVLSAGIAAANAGAGRDPNAELPAWPFAVGANAAVAVVAIWSVRRRP
jgi:hypothetical protein